VPERMTREGARFDPDSEGAVNCCGVNHWNTVYMEHAIAALRGHGIAIDDEALSHLSPIGWERVNLTGDYTWQASGRLRTGSFRPLRPFTASNE
jgi:hypothetical protein